MMDDLFFFSFFFGYNILGTVDTAVMAAVVFFGVTQVLKLNW